MKTINTDFIFESNTGFRDAEKTIDIPTPKIPTSNDINLPETPKIPEIKLPDTDIKLPRVFDDVDEESKSKFELLMNSDCLDVHLLRLASSLVRRFHLIQYQVPSCMWLALTRCSCVALLQNAQVVRAQSVQ